MSTDLIQQAADRLGMKPHREVRDAVQTDDGVVALTHDGNWTLIRPDGTFEAKVPEPVPAKKPAVTIAKK